MFGSKWLGAQNPRQYIGAVGPHCTSVNLIARFFTLLAGQNQETRGPLCLPEALVALQFLALPFPQILDVHGRRVVEVTAMCPPARARASGITSVPSFPATHNQPKLRGLALTVNGLHGRLNHCRHIFWRCAGMLLPLRARGVKGDFLLHAAANLEAPSVAPQRQEALPIAESHDCRLGHSKECPEDRSRHPGAVRCDCTGGGHLQSRCHQNECPPELPDGERPEALVDEQKILGACA